MGVDVNLYAQGEVTDEQLAEANAFLMSRGIFDCFEEGDSPPLARSSYEPGRVEWVSPPRYYGPGYERGHWPEIHNAIVCLRVTLPHCTVHYGGDSVDDAPEVTDEMLAETWRHWLGPDGQAYRRAIRAREVSRTAPGVSCSHGG